MWTGPWPTHCSRTKKMHLVLHMLAIISPGLAVVLIPVTTVLRSFAIVCIFSQIAGYIIAVSWRYERGTTHRLKTQSQLQLSPLSLQQWTQRTYSDFIVPHKTNMGLYIKLILSQSENNTINPRLHKSQKISNHFFPHTLVFSTGSYSEYNHTLLYCHAEILPSTDALIISCLTWQTDGIPLLLLVLCSVFVFPLNFSNHSANADLLYTHVCACVCVWDGHILKETGYLDLNQCSICCPILKATAAQQTFAIISYRGTQERKATYVNEEGALCLVLH